MYKDGIDVNRRLTDSSWLFSYNIELNSFHENARSHRTRHSQLLQYTLKQCGVCALDIFWFSIPTAALRMASLPQAGSNPAAQASSRSRLLTIEDQFNKRIDDDIAKLIDCFADIVRIGEVHTIKSIRIQSRYWSSFVCIQNRDKDKFRVAEEGYQIESQSAQIVRGSNNTQNEEHAHFHPINQFALYQVRSAESLLSLITELKQHLLLNDTETLSRLYDQRKRQLTTQTAEIKDTLYNMREKLAKTTYELESVYFRSLTGPWWFHPQWPAPVQNTTLLH